MSKTRLSPLQRAYRLGYLRALNRCRADLHALAANFDAEIASLQSEARKELHRLATSFGVEIGNAIARRVHREKINRAVQQAVDERATIPDGWLN